MVRAFGEKIYILNFEKLNRKLNFIFHKIVVFFFFFKGKSRLLRSVVGKAGGR